MSVHALSSNLGTSYLYGNKTYIARYFYVSKHVDYVWAQSLLVSIIYPFVLLGVLLAHVAIKSYERYFVPTWLFIKEAQFLIVLVLSAVMLIMLTISQMVL